MGIYKLRSVVVLLFLTFLALYGEAKPVLKKSWALKGLGLELMNRDDPGSPFCNPTASRHEILLNAIDRSRARFKLLKSRLAFQLAPMNHTQALMLNSFLPSRAEPAGGLVAGPLSLGEYLISLKLGTPAKDVLLTIDTGSDITWTQCAPCVLCYQQQLPIFNPAKSSSYAEFNCQNPTCNSTEGLFTTCSPGDNSCSYETIYGDGSSTMGSLSSETFTFTSEDKGDISVPNIVFGCGRLNQGLFALDSGLLGLDGGKYSFATQLKNVFGGKFSYCLTDKLASANATSFLFFGETESEGLKHTPILPGVPGATGFYYLRMLGISVGEMKVKFDPAVLKLNKNGTGGTIIDSGTTVTHLPNVVYKPFTKLFLRESKLKVAPPSNFTSGVDYCFAFKKFPRRVPTVTFHLENVDLVFGADSIFIGPLDPAGELYCLAFFNSGPIGGSFSVIIGNNQQQNYRIEYDLEKSRIGFKKTDCAAP